MQPPPEEVVKRPVLDWVGRHTKLRDSKAICHHYDVSNRFYEWVLGPSMSYTCAATPSRDATLEEAQWNKFDLVARKLGLQPGMRLLDVGCGWGGMVLHAAKEYGVTALGVTLSAQQADWAQQAIEDRACPTWPRCATWTTATSPRTGFDAVSSIGLTEHIGGQATARRTSRSCTGKLRPHGRLLNHCITRPATTYPAKAGKFIDRYVFPDGELEAVGEIVAAMQDNGLEVRHEENLREHYARTLSGWCDNLVENWDEAVAGGRREPGAGVAAVHGRLPGRFRPRGSSSCTRCSACAATTPATRTSPSVRTGRTNRISWVEVIRGDRRRPLRTDR